MIKCIIFDFDGVIIDSLKPTFLTWKKISEEFNAKVKINNIEQYKKLFKNNIIKMLESIGLSKKESKRSVEIYIETLEKNPSKLFKGIKRVLNKLSKDYTLALVSGSQEKVIKNKLKKEKMLDLFKVLIPIIKLERNKPDPYPRKASGCKMKTLHRNIGNKHSLPIAQPLIRRSGYEDISELKVLSSAESIWQDDPFLLNSASKMLLQIHSNE